jgi:hypothetical protein
MRKASAGVSHDNFHGWMDVYIELLNKTVGKDSPFTAKHEKAEVLGAFVFKICAQWEILVEDLLVDCLNRDSTQYAEFMGLRLRKHVPRAECTAMIRGLGYLDFRGVNDIKQKAKSILVNEFNPFQAISNNDSKKIDEFYKIRNYLAHYSRVAERSLMKMYADTYRLNTLREPGDFLLTYDKKIKSARMQLYINAFIGAADSMADELGV